MKRAIGYIRISDKDQSHFSITGQEKYIRDYCERNSIQVISIYIDEGRSAKNFDRPDWKKMEAFIEKEHQNVDYLIVVKYDRFSRNAAEGLYKIEKLEKRFSIIIISIFEQMSIDYDSPFYFKQRADMLVNAEFELHVIRDRTKFGMHTALSTGRYITQAPTGYLNTRDESKKPIIVIDPETAPLIRHLFKLFQQGAGVTEVYRALVEMGWKRKGNSTITNILTNPVYGGLVRVPAYKKEPEKYVKGIHEGYITEGEWWDIQSRFKNSFPRTRINEEVPLKSAVKCFCGKPLSAGNSKGRTKYYWYYICPDHRKFNLSAIKLHEQFEGIVNELKWENKHLDHLYKISKYKMEEGLKMQKEEQVKAMREHQDITAKLNSLEEKVILNVINPETYQKWHNRYKAIETSVKFRIEQLTGDVDQLWQKFEMRLPLLGNMLTIYKKATVIQKHLLIKMWFKSNLRYEGGVFRTTFIMDVFRPKLTVLKEKRLLIFEEPSLILENIPLVPRTGFLLSW